MAIKKNNNHKRILRMTTGESDPIAILDYSTSRSWILFTIRCCREGIPLNQQLWNNHLSFAQRTYWQYTRITPVALEIYEDNTHIKPSIGHSINTGMHMCICGSACHSCFLALTDTDNCFPLTASGGRSKKYHSIDSPVIKTGCTHIWPDSGYVHYLHGWVSVFD